jgi:hypothetical protein
VSLTFLTVVVDTLETNGFIENNSTFRMEMLNRLLVVLERMHLPDPSKNCPLRRDEVLLIKKKLGYDGWKPLNDTGRRLISEIVSSSLKRVLGEKRSPFKEIQIQKIEAGLKVMLYNKSISL